MNQHISMGTVRRLVAILAAVLLGIAQRHHPRDPIALGVSGPFTGSKAQYDAQWLKRLAGDPLNTDWGRISEGIFVTGAKEDAAELVAAEGFLPDEKDRRSTPVRIRDAKPYASPIMRMAR